ncbi:hypothetical protein VPH35_094862 [Triticum aestivum]
MSYVIKMNVHDHINHNHLEDNFRQRIVGRLSLAPVAPASGGWRAPLSSPPDPILVVISSPPPQGAPGRSLARDGGGGDSFPPRSAVAARDAPASRGVVLCAGRSGGTARGGAGGAGSLRGRGGCSAAGSRRDGGAPDLAS